MINTHTVGLLIDETGTAAALVSAGPIFGLPHRGKATSRTFGAPLVFRPVHNGSAQLSYFIYSCTVRTRTHRNTQQLSPPRARELASKRALHPIHNVKQPKNKRRLEAPILILNFLSFSRGQETGGAERDRTDDLLLAKQALSQLSYGPNKVGPARIGLELRARKVGGPGKI